MQEPAEAQRRQVNGTAGRGRRRMFGRWAVWLRGRDGAGGGEERCCLVELRVVVRCGRLSSAAARRDLLIVIRRASRRRTPELEPHARDHCFSGLGSLPLQIQSSFVRQTLCWVQRTSTTTTNDSLSHPSVRPATRQHGECHDAYLNLAICLCALIEHCRCTCETAGMH